MGDDIGLLSQFKDLLSMQCWVEGGPTGVDHRRALNRGVA